MAFETVDVRRVSRYFKLLLYVAKKENVPVTSMDYQKLFFLLEKEKGMKLGLDFKRGWLGPKSDVLQELVDLMEDCGLIKEVEVRKDQRTNTSLGPSWTYVLTCRFKPKKYDEDVAEFFRYWLRRGTKELLDYVYEKYKDWWWWDPLRELNEIREQYRDHGARSPEHSPHPDRGA